MLKRVSHAGRIVTKEAELRRLSGCEKRLYEKRWVALFRGINVGGNVLPMRDLVNELKALKLEDVRAYTQSGNVIFDSDIKNVKALSKSITERFEQQSGFSPKVLIISSVALRRAIDANPFPDATADPKSLHFYFLEKPERPVSLTFANFESRS